jgi:16S rRNA C1402 (ribose-2'-O) methylase RsmI
VDKFARQTKDYLKSFQIDDQLVAEHSQNADDHLANLEKLLGELKGAQFNGQLLKFTPSELKIESIGALEFNKLKVPQNFDKISPDLGRKSILLLSFQT